MKKRHLLYVGPSYPASASRYFVDAFERLGWEVTRVSAKYHDHGNIDWGNDLPQVDIELPRQADWYIDDLIDQSTKMKGNPVEFVFLIEESYNNKIENTKKVPSAVWSCDGWPEAYARREAIDATVFFTSHPRGIVRYPLPKIPDGCRWLPGAAAPWCHRNYFKPLEKRQYDFCLLATPYSVRPELCEALRAAGLSVKSGLVATKEYVDSYNDAVFSYHNAGGQCEVKWRMPEGMLMGCVQIADHMELFPELGFHPMVHYIPISVERKNNGELWPDYQDLASKIKEMRHESWLSNIAVNAWWTTLERHTYYVRAYEIMTSVGIDPQVTLAELKTRAMQENSTAPPK
jgi:hypothetical protein